MTYVSTGVKMVCEKVQLKNELPSYGQIINISYFTARGTPKNRDFEVVMIGKDPFVENQVVVKFQDQYNGKKYENFWNSELKKWKCQYWHSIN